MAENKEVFPERELSTVNELVKGLRLSRSTIYKELKDGKIHARRFGGRILFARNDILEYIEKSSTKLAA